MEEFVTKLVEAAYQGSILVFKYIFIAVSSFFAGVIIYAWHKTRWARVGAVQRVSEFLQTTAYETTQFIKKWEAVKKRLEKEWESEAKLAVIEADEMLKEVLERTAYTGEDIESRLEKVPSKVLPNKEELKKAHQLCSDIVHDPDYKLSLGKAQWAIAVYEQSFRHLDAL